MKRPIVRWASFVLGHFSYRATDVGLGLFEHGVFSFLWVTTLDVFNENLLRFHGVIICLVKCSLSLSHKK